MRGGDTSALRSYNERLILEAIRTRGPLSKAEIARTTGLSAQAAAVIVRALLADGMLIEHDKVRGRVGQPMTPLALNPSGAFSLGVMIGRRGVDAALIDFTGAPLAMRRARYAAPLRQPTMALAVGAAQAALAALAPEQRRRVVGLGLAMPGEMHLWAREVGLPAGALDDWRSADPAGELAVAIGLPAQAYNDATAACAAELALGGGLAAPDALYVFVAGFIGGGVVLGGRLQHGGRGNAGALGSMPMAENGPDGRPRQLIHDASLVTLEAGLRAAGVDPAAAIAGDAADPAAEAAFETWAGVAAQGLARAVAASASVFDFEVVVIDGALNRGWLGRLIARTRERLGGFDLSGLSALRVEQGTVGPDARVMGAAILPLHARFSPQPELLARAPGLQSDAA